MKLNLKKIEEEAPEDCQICLVYDRDIDECAVCQYESDESQFFPINVFCDGWHCEDMEVLKTCNLKLTFEPYYWIGIDEIEQVFEN